MERQREREKKRREIEKLSICILFIRYLCLLPCTQGTFSNRPANIRGAFEQVSENLLYTI